MQIYYENLLYTLPSKVDIVTLNDQKKKLRATHLYPFFLENNLKAAFELAFPRINNEMPANERNNETNNDTTANDTTNEAT